MRGYDSYSLAIVERNLRSARLLMENSRNSFDLCDSAYYIQQACEKMIKIQVYKLSNTSTPIRGHNICALINYYKNLRGICIPVDIIKYCRLLSNWESQTRCNENYFVESRMVSYILKLAENWYLELKRLGY